MACRTFWRKLGRTKDVSDIDSLPSGLEKCLGLVDLTAIGVGSTLGVGIYVLAGDVAKFTAGPAVVFSFLIAALVSLLAGLCYAEFGARMHITGSAYTYAYVAVGELIAFIIGWSMLAECIIGAASVGAAWSGYLDAVADSSISHFIQEHIGTFDSPFLGDYPDFLAFGIAAAMTVVLIMGAKFNSMTMLIFTALNIGVVGTCIIAGLFYADIENWKGDGGFFPFGATGIIEGAATCFYAFVGFDVIAVSSEEARNPARDIPLAIILTLTICFVTYVCTSLVLTLVVPYYALSASAPLAEAFETRGAMFITYLIAIGSILALTASMLGSIFPIPRLAYAMSRDGLVFQFLSIISPTTKVPVVGCLIAGGITAVVALMMSMKQLVEMMSIGTLVAYMLVAASIVLLRYKPSDADKIPGSSTSYQDMDVVNELERLPGKNEENIARGSHSPVQKTTPSDTEMTDFGKDRTNEKDALVGPRKPTAASYSTVQICTFVYGVASCVLSEVLANGMSTSIVPVWVPIALLVGCVGTLVVTAYMIANQPEDDTDIPFRVPFTPYLPLLSMTCDLYLMSHLSYKTWIRFIVWLFCGLMIYFGYGIGHSRADHAELDESRDIDETTKGTPGDQKVK